MPADTARLLFLLLSLASRPRVTNVFDVLSSAVAGASLLTLLLCLVSFVVPFPQRLKDNRGKLARCSMWVLLICFLAAIVTRIPLHAGGSLGVDVIAEHRVGIYDVSVVRADGAESLIDWLNEHSFRFGDRDTAAFNAYVSKGWCFVVALINPSADEDEIRVASEGLAAPLILRFPHATPIYPVALTGTGGFETEVLIYLASSTKMTARDRLTLRFASEMLEDELDLLALDSEPRGFFDPKKLNFPYLCKFRDTLTPDKMTEDIVFDEAEDAAPYREHIFEW